MPREICSWYQSFEVGQNKKQMSVQVPRERLEFDSWTVHHVNDR